MSGVTGCSGVLPSGETSGEISGGALVFSPLRHLVPDLLCCALRTAPQQARRQVYWRSGGQWRRHLERHPVSPASHEGRPCILGLWTLGERGTLGTFNFVGGQVSPHTPPPRLHALHPPVGSADKRPRARVARTGSMHA